MDTKATDNFISIIAAAQSTCEQVEYVTDVTPKRKILRLKAKYGLYRVLITELFSEEVRKYSYYVLLGDRVEAGFDNSPDPRAIRLKYGQINDKHCGKHIPHLHQDDKTRLSLTKEMTCTTFFDWLKTNIHPTKE